MTRWSLILLFYIFFERNFLLGNNVTEAVKFDDKMESEREAVIGQSEDTLEGSTRTSSGLMDDQVKKKNQKDDLNMDNRGNEDQNYGFQGQSHLNFEKKSAGRIPYWNHDDIKKLKEILESEKGLGFLQFLVNYRLGRQKMTPPLLTPSTSVHFQRGQEILPSFHENDYPELIGKEKDPLSHSSNQLWKNIYEHQGTMLGNLETEAQAQNLRNNHIHHMEEVNSWNWNPNYTLLEKEKITAQKRLTPNSAYICHFKLCQFGSSGKRLYKSTSQFESLEKEE